MDELQHLRQTAALAPSPLGSPLVRFAPLIAAFLSALHNNFHVVSCRVHVAWSRRVLLGTIETKGENLATYAT